jgi:hypothetical protein
MAEKLKTPEQGETLRLPTSEQAEPLRKGERDPAEGKHNKAEAVAEARGKVQETAGSETTPNPVEAVQAAEKAARPATPLHVNSELKNITLKRELNAIRRRENAPERTLSRIIHQPVIRAVSEPLGKTVSRPSGLLGGGLVACIGTGAYLVLARHAGMRYQYSVFLLLFAGGFVLGLLLELLVYAATSGHRHRND